MIEISPVSQQIGDFVEWLGYEEKLKLCAYYPEEEIHLPVHVRLNGLLAEFFGIDEDKMEAERTALLDALRQPSAAGGKE